MTKLLFHYKSEHLPDPTKDRLPILLYGLKNGNEVYQIGNPIIDKIKRLGVKLPAQVIDFLSITLAVIAADTFVRRTDAGDGWTRELSLKLPVSEPDRWRVVKEQLERTLHFLSGDIWEFDFVKGGFTPPIPYNKTKNRSNEIEGLDSVCLFSGGLDSAVGAIDLIENGGSPLLVSYGYKGDKNHQDEVASHLKGKFSRFIANANPISLNKKTDITMRTRSLSFLSLGVIGACAVQIVNGLKKIDLVVPENGLISLNAPLTSRRIGSLSTRTTHPYFLSMIQEIFAKLEINCLIKNPYQFKTKGEMVFECRNKTILKKIVSHTVSCSHWKRKNQQCGICVPCLIRRAALFRAGLAEKVSYSYNKIGNVLEERDKKDDLMALQIATSKENSRNLNSWIIDSGPLPLKQLNSFKNTFSRGLEEVRIFLSSQDV
ncbi:Qat anti-phage system QueC-like protein QatC [Leptospira sp. SA-E8]|uniref:Qat anti-phage system QueC-like protein QatC n=1 Tax=Leptospira sp. SA-E8 TaxID=3422259 RepID=UPI003EBF22BF